jgi:hypothetical protein
MPCLLEPCWCPLEPSTDCVLVRERYSIPAYLLGLWVSESTSDDWVIDDFLSHLQLHGFGRSWLECFQELGEILHLIEESSIILSVLYLLNNTVDSRISACIVASEHEPQILGCWVDHIQLSPDWILVAVLDERNCSLVHNTVAVVDVSPNTLDIVVVHVLDHVHIACFSVASREVVVSLSLP